MNPPVAGRSVLLLLLMIAAGAVLRASVAVRNPIPMGDGISSEIEMARNLAAGDGFSTMRKWTMYDPSMIPMRPEGNRQPAMSVILSGVFALFGVSFQASQVVSIGIGLACIVCIWLWARRIFGEAAALLTAAWFVFDPLFVWYSTQPDSVMLFTALFTCILMVGDSGHMGPMRALLLGALCALSWLSRTQGLILAATAGLWVLFRGRPRFGSTVAFALAFSLVALPWMIRNWTTFGSPFFSQAFQLLFSHNPYSVWEVRQSPIDPLENIRGQSPFSLVAYLAAGTLRVLEPFTIGTLHRGEPFDGPSLAVFLLAGLLLLRDPGARRRLVLPIFFCLPMIASLVMHMHPTRYLAFAMVVAVSAGFGGLVKLSSILGAGRVLRAGAGTILALLLVRALASEVRLDSRPRAAEAREISGWIAANTAPGDWVVTFPNVEMYVWDYRRPTLTMPDDYEMLLWPALQEHGVRFVIVDPDLPRTRPWLSDRWRMSPDGSGWDVIDPPPFLREVARSRSGLTLVYEWVGTVPAGFMEVESLPPDNFRALPPSAFSPY
jgi:hypothetical protein